MDSFILWRGASEIDGKPIVCVATGVGRPSQNAKTGPMVQIFVMVDGKLPMDAIKDGSHDSVCGSCPHRGGPGNGVRTCYVNVAKSVQGIGRKLMAEGYPSPSPLECLSSLKGKRVRVGAYGDPGALPNAVLEPIMAISGSWTGYTRRWRERPDLAGWLMASCDTEAEREEAKALGWRTFRILCGEESPDVGEEVMCPNITKGKLCFECGLCCGMNREAKDVCIPAHGQSKARYEQNRLTKGK